MKNPFLNSAIYFPLILISFLLLSACQKILRCPVNEANISVVDIKYEETSRRVILDPPSGSYQPDNPNFDPRDSTTWTGNMAQYVKKYIKYTRSFSVYNAGTGTAFDAEVDVHIKYRSGAESIETILLGKICPEELKFWHRDDITHTDEIKSVSTELYWYDD